MTPTDYLEQSGRTAAPVDLSKKTCFPNNNSVLHQSVDVITGGQSADMIKRAVFYHSPLDKMQVRGDTHLAMVEKIYLGLAEAELDLDVSDVEGNLLHAILGISSEAGEMMEELILAKTSGRDLDLINMREEVGDIMWYLAMALRATGGTFEEAMERNIAKLSIRYPDKFTSEKAHERDLSAEQESLGQDA